MDFRFALIGLIIGFLIGSTGMGGGSLMTPVMILVMGVKPAIAVGTDLAYGAITKIVGSAAHLRQGTVDRTTAYLLASGSVPATLLGVGLISRIKSSHPEVINSFLLRAIACTLIVVAILLILKPFLARTLRGQRQEGPINWRETLMARGRQRIWMLPAVGAVVGFLVGLTSVGSGTIVVAALLFLYPRWESKQYVGTDVFHAAILVSAASVAHLWAGNVNLPMMFSLLVGSLPGVLVGSRLAFGLSEQYLRWSLASVLLVSGAKLL